MSSCLRMARATRSSVSPAGRHLARLRLVAALPAVLASALLLALLCVPLGGWPSSLLAGWLAVVPALHTRVGERVAVAVGCRFRAPRRAVRVALDPVWHSACCAAGIAVADVDLYLKRDGGVNAYAAGRRSVAVTTGALTAFLTGSLPPRQMEALLLHELGHHAIGGLRYGLAAAWLAWPWRAARHLVLGLCFWAIARRQPRVTLAVVMAGGVLIAVAQSVEHGHLAAAVVLAAVSVCAVACPTIDAWASRRVELAADQFAASCGAGPALAVLLASIAPPPRRRSAPWVLRRHPPTVDRLARLGEVG